MKLTVLAAGAAFLLLGSAAAAPTTTTKNKNNDSNDSDNAPDLDKIDYKCAGNINYQLINYLNTNSLNRTGATCYKGNGDKSGYTAGIVNFSTQYGDALGVISLYAKDPTYNKEFDALIPTLQKYAQETSGSVEGLDKFCDAWESAANNGRAFYEIQVKYARENYDKPAQLAARYPRLRFPISKSVVFDTAVTNGLGDEGNSLGALIAATNSTITADDSGDSGSTLAVGKFSIDEIKWLTKFLDIREEKSGDNGKGHIAAYRSLIDRKAYMFDGTIEFIDSNSKKIQISCNKAAESTS
ncbi:hypothetical protein H4R18_003081 [Coemansia javaensis]|uniref:Chitosanase n=1 Tax=Coemansia javaensis TaxID=2761396 RepID=A0A9W8LI89_9FUNG|nr:hypothetical protein H4R18_003081 [Coemansia javaensis]